MNNNEKVAIVGRLWEPNDFCVAATCSKVHGARWEHLAPDMHDPVNLFRAMTNRWQDLLKMKKMWTDERSLTFVAFECLLDLYNTEHPND